ncbi:MAG: hypothetical protein U0931_41360 [Vulcanimicrobiota bacterium]
MSAPGMGPWDIACELTRALIEAKQITTPAQAAESVIEIQKKLHAEFFRDER